MADGDMAWAVFSREFNWSRPKSPLLFHVTASPDPQQKPRDVIEAAIKAGAAVELPAPDKAEAKRLKRGKI